MKKACSSHLLISLLLATFALYAGAQSQQPPSTSAASPHAVASGTPFNIATTVSGQTSKFTFTAKAGEHASMVLTNSTYPANCPRCVSLYVSVVRPDGTTLGVTSLGSSLSNNGFLNPLNLPLNGTYTIVATPQGGATGSVTATLYVFNDLVETITPGVAKTVTTTIPGQKVRLMFSASAGQHASVSVTDSTFGSCSKCNAVAVRIHSSPFAAALSSASLSASATGASVNSVALPATRTYSVVVDPQGARTGSAVVTLSLQ